MPPHSSLPDPEIGLVLSYSYLWHVEGQAGLEEGRKDRPSVIVLAVEREVDGALLVTVLPVTHTAPLIEGGAIEIPSPIKRHLGLDEGRSWVVITEGNEFVWPGHDLRRVRRTGRYAYGFLPPGFFTQVQTAFLAWHDKANQSIMPRT